jgi:hypothetical protein
MSRRRLLVNYLVGLSFTLLGAWGMDVTGSMLPLALGAAATVMQTASTVAAVWRRQRA